MCVFCASLGVFYESVFHLQITSVEVGVDQLVPYVCKGLWLDTPRTAGNPGKSSLFYITEQQLGAKIPVGIPYLHTVTSADT